MNKNILVTGSHRSGTTWTGHVLAKAKKVRYIHEPFNMEHPGINSPFKYWFEHMNDSPDSYQQKVKDYLNTFSAPFFHQHTIKRLLNIKSLRGIQEFLLDSKGRITANRTVYKDPIAIMSAEWIYENYNWDIVVLIRHPAAFVASLKMKKWTFDFNEYLGQSNLMENYLAKYSETLKEYAKNEKDIIDQGILFWNTFHDVISYYQEKYGDDWYFVKHETLSTNPIAEFESLFSYLNLKFSTGVKNYIIKSTTSNKKSRLKRDSVKNIKTWKKRLSPEEVERIKIGTQKVWPKFYEEEDW